MPARAGSPFWRACGGDQDRGAGAAHLDAVDRSGDTTLPSHRGPPAGTPSEAEKSAALEARAARHRLTQGQVQALIAVGVPAAEYLQHIERPWGMDDTALARRLARARRWSPTAIAVFLRRPEALVRAALRPQVRARG